LINILSHSVSVSDVTMKCRSQEHVVHVENRQKVQIRLHANQRRFLCD
jgi:hypothetical protein